MRLILGFVVVLALTGPAAAQYQFQQPLIQPVPIQPNFQDQFRGDHNSPRIYDSQGQYRGNLNSNQFDPNSVANPYGRYGNPYSADSLNNPYSRR